MMLRSLALGLATLLASAHPSPGQPSRPGVVRFATFNASLNRDEPGGLIRDLSRPDNAQARNVAEIIQRVAPDVILINEFDHDPDYKASSLFLNNYLAVGQNGADPIAYPYVFAPEVNTGVASGHDLDGDGRVEDRPRSRPYGNDAFGYGLFPGQYGMLLLSKHPIEADRIRDFQKLRWKDMPGALLPTKPDGSGWYGEDALEVFRLSSKTHVIIPVRVNGRTIDVLASHPTPPAFDGPEDRNGRRNFDEIRIWADLLRGGERASYLGPAGSSTPGSFVILGDLNADPLDGGSVPGAIDQLLSHPRVNATFLPISRGGAEAGSVQGGANIPHRGRPEADTADFDDRSVGNLRVDYVLPSADLKVVAGAVFWPGPGDPLERLVRMKPVASSDHRLVYLDIEVPAGPSR